MRDDSRASTRDDEERRRRRSRPNAAVSNSAVRRTCNRIGALCGTGELGRKECKGEWIRGRVGSRGGRGVQACTKEQLEGNSGREQWCDSARRRHFDCATVAHTDRRIGCSTLECHRVAAHVGRKVAKRGLELCRLERSVRADNSIARLLSPSLPLFPLPPGPPSPHVPPRRTASPSGTRAWHSLWHAMPIHKPASKHNSSSIIPRAIALAHNRNPSPPSQLAL